MKTFTHQQAQEILHAGQVESELDRKALAQHLSACAECRAYATLVNELVQVVPVLYPSVSLSERTIRQKAAGKHTLVRRKVVMNRALQGTRTMLWIGASLALLVILVILSPRLLPSPMGGESDPGPIASMAAPVNDPMTTPIAQTPEITPASSQGSIQYTVLQGDTLIGIADKFNLKPQTILWSNIDVLFDNPHKLQPGITLRIPSVDGLYYRWETGDSIETVAARFGADPQVVRAWPENAGQFEPRAEIFIPGGERPMQPAPTIIAKPDEVKTEEIPFCDQLDENYTPTDGFKLYCDEQYQYAFDYPLGWEIEGLNRPIPDATAFPEAYPQVLQFFERDYRNQVYIYTGVLPEGSSLLDVVRNHNAYDDRAFKKDYSPMQMGGKPAYGFVNRYVQDYSGVSLFFEHGDFYTLMYMKIISPAGLGVNWQIAGSIQVPGTSPENNVISDDLIDDSYSLIGTVRPTPTATSEPLTTPIPNKTGLTIEENEIIGQVSLEPLTFQPVHGSQQDIMARHAPGKGKLYSFPDGFEQNGAYVIYPVTGDGHFRAVRESDSAKIVLQQDEVTILQIDAGDVSPITPMRGLWVVDEHWVLETAYVKNIIDGNSIYSDAVGQIYRDGVLLNEKFGYEEMFGFQLLDEKPFYFYKKDGRIYLSYNNEDLPVVYDEITHYRCCSGAALNPIAGINWIGFWGQRDGVWYYTEIGRY